MDNREYMHKNEEARHEDGLPTDTETQTSPSVAEEPKHRNFAKVPRGLLDTLKRDALNFAEFGLLTFLIAAIDHRTGEYVNRLSAIRDESAWEHGEEYLRKCLKRLREELWIDFDMRPGSRGPYVIRLGPRYYAALLYGTELLPELNPDLQLTSNSPLIWNPPSDLKETSNSDGLPELAKPHENGDGDNPRPQTDPSP